MKLSVKEVDDILLGDTKYNVVESGWKSKGKGKDEFTFVIGIGPKEFFKGAVTKTTKTRKKTQGYGDKETTQSKVDVEYSHERGNGLTLNSVKKTFVKRDSRHFYVYE